MRIPNPKLVVVVYKKAKVHETAPGSYMRTSVRNKRKNRSTGASGNVWKAINVRGFKLEQKENVYSSHGLCGVQQAASRLQGQLFHKDYKYPGIHNVLIWELFRNQWELINE